MKFPQVKLSSYARRKLNKVKPVTLRTLYLTEKGPAVGTIWQWIKHKEAMVVAVVEDGWISYEHGIMELVSDFMDAVDEGEYILIGSCHPVMSYVPHLPQ